MTIRINTSNLPPINRPCHVIMYFTHYERFLAPLAKRFEVISLLSLSLSSLWTRNLPRTLVMPRTCYQSYICVKHRQSAPCGRYSAPQDSRRAASRTFQDTPHLQCPGQPTHALSGVTTVCFRANRSFLQRCPGERACIRKSLRSALP